MRRLSCKQGLPPIVATGLLLALSTASRPAFAADPAAEAPADQPASASAAPSPDEPRPHPVSSKGIPLVSDRAGWGVSMYGFAELDTMYDSTRSFADSVTNNTLARPHTYAGDNPRVQFSVRNSRLGFDLHAPDVGKIETSAVIEMDFFGSQANSDENSLYANQVLRLRHFYVKFQTPIVDILAGQYHDLYGWGGAGFYPNSVAFLPLLGEIYHRNPQFRLSKVFGGHAVSVEIAAAAVRPAQRDSKLPDGQVGIRLALNEFKGAATPGASRPTSAPFAVGISAVGRRLSVTDFSATPGNEHTTYAGGVAGNIFLPILPAHGRDKEDLGNALTLTVEGSTGSGVSDLSPGLTGGVSFPSLPNPQNYLPVPLYTPNIDPGLATYDSFNVLHTINWSSVVANLHYHFPIEQGKRLWLSVTGSLIKSNNDVDLTPVQGRAFVWNSGNYEDASLWIGVTQAAVLAVSVQTMAETFGDSTTARNWRGEGSCYFFF